MSTWYFDRLKTMSLPEIFFRLNQYVQKKKEIFFHDRIIPESDLLSTSDTIIDFDLSDIEPFHDTINVFGKMFNYLENKTDWHRDIFSGGVFPKTFSKNINIRSNPKASAKNVWEINRLQFLPQILMNYRKTGKEIYLTRFMEILTSWTIDNPYLIGVNWYSNIEVNIRLINWFFCWQILDAENLTTKNERFKNFLETRWIPTIYQHCYYSYHNPSKYSSANNHLISEYAGLFIASSVWKFKESGKWLHYAAKGLETEIRLQHSSGINKEEAAEYIQFITDFFLIAYIVGEKTGKPFSDEYRKQLKEIFGYICTFLDCKGNFPKYGDEDDGKCVNFSAKEHFNNFRSLLTSGAIIFKDQSFKSKSNGFDTKNAILWGAEGKQIYESIPDVAVDESSAFFKTEGHFFFKKLADSREIYFHFDAAPLGYLSIAGHGHADALSFILNLDGEPVFIDSGTYTYHTDPEWRKYFVGTLSHNTIRINGKDQAVNAGPTMWLKHYKSKVINVNQNEETESVKATHNGYKKEKAEHIREVVFNKLKNEFIITDTLNIKGEGYIEVEIPFHLHPDINLQNSTKNNYLLTTKAGNKLEFNIDDKLSLSLINGQIEPQILGWYSESFLKKKETNVIYGCAQLKSTTTFNHVIKIL